MRIHTVSVIVYGLLRSREMTQVTCASLKEYVIKQVIRDPRDVLFSVDGTKSWFPTDLHIHNKSRILTPLAKMNTSETYRHAMKHVLYGLTMVQNYQIIVISRVDVEYASYLTLPRVVPNSITVPTFQNYGYLNDRFCIGDWHTLSKWFKLRLSLVQKLIFAEKGACYAAKLLHFNVSRTNVKFVRRRHNLFVPDVDKATAWKSIPVRHWMRDHEKSCL